MDWLRISVFTTAQGMDLVCAALSAVGIDQVELLEGAEQIGEFLQEVSEQWDFADPRALQQGDGRPCVRIYAPDSADGEQTLQKVRSRMAWLQGQDVGVDLGELMVEVQKVHEEDWANNWKKYYKPLPIGKRLLIKPEWEPVEDDQGRIVLEMNPGMVFGTGTHQTTQLCLMALEKRVQPGMQVLDLGCGSGILSIAALLLGAGHATAVDIDPIAENIAYENAAMNGIGKDRYTVKIGNILQDKALIQEVGEGYPIVVANIIADVIIGLTHIVPDKLAPGGCLIASGIIKDRAVEVCEAIRAAGLTVKEQLVKDEWVAIVAER